MVKYNFKFIIAFALLVTFFSCEQEDVPMYQQNGAVYFKDSLYSYSFLENPNVASHTIKLPVIISGEIYDRARTFKVKVLENDTTTTAEESMYELNDGVVEAGQATGYIPLVLKYSEKLNDSIYKIKLELVVSDNFPEIRLNKMYLTVSFTNQLVEPANWVWISSYFGGQYSSAWYRFILAAINMPRVPYYPGHVDKETWWMDYNALQRYVAVVRYELEKYNMNNPRLKHDDGEWAGFEVKSF